MDVEEWKGWGVSYDGARLSSSVQTKGKPEIRWPFATRWVEDGKEEMLTITEQQPKKRGQEKNGISRRSNYLEHGSN